MRPKLKLLPSADGHVRCSRPSCRRELNGPVRTNAMLNPDRPPEWCLFLPDGWSVDEAGRWRMQDRARSGFRQGLPDVRRWDYTDDRAHRRQGEAQGWLPWNLPVTIVCDTCRTALDADPEVLQVSPSRHEHSPQRVRLSNPDRWGEELCCNRGQAPGRRWIRVPAELAPS